MDNISDGFFSLEAMASDDLEAERFADYLEAQGLLRAPANLKASVLEKGCHMDVQLTATANRISRRAELFFYGLKVGFAVACSVTAIAVMPWLHRDSGFRSPRKYTPAYVEAYEKIQEWNGKINSFSKSLFNLEVPFYD